MKVALLIVVIVGLAGLTAVVSSPVAHNNCHPNKKAPKVTTEGGVIMGVSEESTKGKTFYAYYSIPFAKPPVGELRFKAPEEGVTWKGVRQGFSPPPPCPQLPSPLDPSFLHGQEDCLFLNVFTSNVKNNGVALPVLVFIHGGSYTAGRAHRHQPYAFLNEEVVLVTLQYRLGILGFLSTEDDVLPGNLGLKDQVSALRWVSRNIEQFGGDPNKVTMVGQSAGASSAHLLMLSPKCEADLFGRVILQSGSALASFALGTNFKETAVTVAKLVGCENNVTSSHALVECLRGVNSEDLVNTLPKLPGKFSLPTLLGPRVDGDLLPDYPEVLASRKPKKQVDLISGYTSHDGAEMLAYVQVLNAETNISQNFAETAPNTLDLSEEGDKSVQLTHWVYNFYMGGPNVDSTEDFVQMVTDRLFVAPQDTCASLHASLAAKEQTGSWARTYRYMFTHRGQHSVLDNYNVSPSPHWVSHSDEMFYMFPGAPDWKALTRPDDLAMRDIFIKLWTNFAATGNPTPDSSLGFTWEPISQDEQKLLNLVPSPFMVKEHESMRKARVFLTTLPTQRNSLLWLTNQTHQES